MSQTHIVLKNGKVVQELGLVHADGIPADAAICVISTDSQKYLARFNHEIFIEVTPEIYRVLEQHLFFSHHVAESLSEPKKEKPFTHDKTVGSSG